MFTSALLGGLFIGILSALPIVNVANCCCLWVTGGGFIAAYLDRDNAPRPFTAGRGALTGLLAGVLGAFVWLIASLTLEPLIGSLQARVAEEMLRSASDMPPSARDWLESVASRASSPFRYMAGFMFHLTVGAMFATIGGTLGGLFFRSDVPPALGGDPIIPPPLPPR